MSVIGSTPRVESRSRIARRASAEELLDPISPPRPTQPLRAGCRARRAARRACRARRPDRAQRAAATHEVSRVTGRRCPFRNPPRAGLSGRCAGSPSRASARSRCDNEVDRADVDAELERGCGHYEGSRRLELLLQLPADAARHAPWCARRRPWPSRSSSGVRRRARRGGACSRRRSSSDASS